MTERIPEPRLTSSLAFEVARPFTMVPPAIGIAMGGAMAVGAGHETATAIVFLKIALAAVAAAVLNGSSNAINQLCDLENDMVNKPDRPFPSGRITARQLVLLSIYFAVPSLLAALFLGVETFVIFVLALLFTCSYSIPPLRFKRVPVLANLVIAIPRGLLLPVAGWSVAAPVAASDPWLVGAVFGVFVLGAASTKDFSDIEGDRAAGCNTLPCIIGLKGTAIATAPFLFLPWLGLILIAMNGGLAANSNFLYRLGAMLAVWGIIIAVAILKGPEKAAEDENHFSWKHMYLLMITAQVGIAASYLL